jgi:hypothetical protein
VKLGFAEYPPAAGAAAFSMIEMRPHFVAKHRTNPCMSWFRTGMGIQLTGNSLIHDVVGQAEKILVARPLIGDHHAVLLPVLRSGTPRPATSILRAAISALRASYSAILRWRNRTVTMALSSMPLGVRR